MEKVKRFDNGIRLVVKKIDGMHSVCASVMVDIGSSLENKENNGYSHLIEHLFFKGTSHRTALQITEAVDDIGGQINAFTSKDSTCFFTKTASEYLETSMDILSDLLYNSTFDPEEIEKEKKVVIEEILMCNDTPDEVCHDLIAQALYNEGSLGQTILGSQQNIMSATRERIVDFIAKYYAPHSICVSIAGNVDYNQAVELTEKYFIKDTQTHDKQEKLDKLPTFSKFLTVTKDVEQSHICLAFPSVPFASQQSIALSIFSSIFGGSMSSRLFQSIREKNGLAYTVYSYPSYYYNNGYLEIYLGTSPKNCKKALGILNDEIIKIINDGFTDSEFTRGIAQVRGGLVLSQENTVNIATAYANYMLKTDRLYDLDGKLDIISTTTKQQVVDVMKEVLDLSKVAVAYVGKKTKLDMLKILCDK